MRTTVTVDDELVERLKDALDIEETSALIRHALKQLRYQLAAEELIRLGGSDPDAWAPNEGDPVPHDL